MIEQENELTQYALVIKQALENILNDTTVSEESRISVLYATPSIAYAKEKANIENGEKAGPLVSFYMKEMEEADGEQMLGFAIQNLSTMYTIRTPIIYRLHYSVRISALNEIEADNLQRKLILSLRSNHEYSVKAEIGNSVQWVCMSCKNPTNESSVEPGESAERISARTLEIVIRRAYIQPDCYEIQEDFLNGKIIPRLHIISGGKY